MARGSKQFKDNADKRNGQSFAPIRMDVIRSEAWANTRAWGTRLIIDLAAQYRGNNNGDLCAAWSVMNVRGWNSKETLNTAKKELIEKKWIVVTRKGGRKVATLYALTFWGIDECNGKLDPHICPRKKPLDTWKIGNAAPNLKEEKAKEKARKIKFSGTATGAIT
jgi:hypothetical protein